MYIFWGLSWLIVNTAMFVQSTVLEAAVAWKVWKERENLTGVPTLVEEKVNIIKGKFGPRLTSADTKMAWDHVERRSLIRVRKNVGMSWFSNR